MSIWTKKISLPYAIGGIGTAALLASSWMSATTPEETSLLSAARSDFSNFTTELSKNVERSGDQWSAMFKDLDTEMCLITNQALAVLESRGAEIVKEIKLRELGFEQSDIDSILNASPELIEGVRAQQAHCPTP